MKRTSASKKRATRKLSPTPAKIAIAQSDKLIKARAYEGASKTQRTKNWRAPNTSATAESYFGLETLRSRTRDLVRNNGFAYAAVGELTADTVGTGILAKLRSEQKSQESKVKALWSEWAETTACDAEGLHDFYGLQALAVRSMWESGEVLIRRRWRRAEDGLPLPMQIQVLEPDFIDTSKNEVSDTRVIVQGIEYDKIGRRVAYWLFSEHPGGRTIFSSPVTSKRVSADDIIHLFVSERPGQVRGIPRGASVILNLRDFSDVQNAFMMLQKIASCFTVFITEGEIEESLGGSDEDEEDEDLPTEVEPGMIFKLRRGQEISTAQPPAITGYKDFSTINLQAVARGYLMPHEKLTGDYSNFSYSSSKMSWLSYYRNIDMATWITIVPRLCRGVWMWFHQAAEISGTKMKGTSSSWTPPRREMIDPATEYRALGLAVRNGFMSLSEAIRQLGYDPVEVLSEKKSDKELLEKLGLVLDTDPEKVTQAGLFQSTKQPAGEKGKDGESDSTGQEENS